ncbi:MAG: hypothetical protein ABIH25_00945 [Candidatus Woesearchaeota archaeon]
MSNHIGSWAFLIGVIIAVVFGLLGTLSSTILTILVILGLIVGLLNITEKEVTQFLMAGTVLVIVSSLGQNVFSTISFVGNILDAILALFVPATVVVALKSVFSIARK